MLRAALGAYFVRRIGGYTGDCLGMAQQLAELSIYLVAAAPQADEKALHCLSHHVALAQPTRRTQTQQRRYTKLCLPTVSVL